MTFIPPIFLKINTRLYKYTKFRRLLKVSVSRFWRRSESTMKNPSESLYKREKNLHTEILSDFGIGEFAVGVFRISRFFLG